MKFAHFSCLLRLKEGDGFKQKKINTEVEKSQTETLPVSCCLSILPVLPWFFILLQSFLFIYQAKWGFYMHVQLLLLKLGLASS